MVRWGAHPGIWMCFRNGEKVRILCCLDEAIISGVRFDPFKSVARNGRL